MKTLCECVGECAGNSYTVPAGTEVMAERDGRGGTVYAVASVRDVERITGRAHDARHYHLWVPLHAIGALFEGAGLPGERMLYTLDREGWPALVACVDCGNWTPDDELGANGGTCDLCERARDEHYRDSVLDS